MDEVTPLVFKIGDTQVQVKNDEKSVKLVTEFMTKNTPKMDEYFHQDWTEETFTKVAEAIIAAVPQREVLEMILERSKDTKMNELIRSKMKPGKSNAPKASVNDDLEFSSTPAKPASLDLETAIESESVSSTDSDDEYDSLFSNL
jgi:hypothetical protein